VLWPFNSVPTGSRGVVTQYGRIIGIENEGLAVLPPWQKLSLFSIRAETAQVDDAQGATSDTQPVDVSLTVPYSVIPDKVADDDLRHNQNRSLIVAPPPGVSEIPINPP
jgi:prohibitin 2